MEQSIDWSMERSMDESMSQQAGKANGTHMLLRSMLYPRIEVSKLPIHHVYYRSVIVAC
jgi:hypothetical protein